jgi:putative iron-dependent peroxidase
LAQSRTLTPLQEDIVRRAKNDNIECDDDDAPRKSQKLLATVVDVDGNEHILRANVPFGQPGNNSAWISLAIRAYARL